MSALRPDLTFADGPNALQRLGLVLWWLSLAVAILLLALGAWLGWLMTRAEPGLGIFVIIVAAVAWAAGRAVLFVLAGR